MEMGLSLDGSSFSFTFDTETHPEKVANELVAKFSDSLTEGAGCVRGGRACLVAAVASVIERQVEQRRLDGWLELGTTITWFLKLNPSNPRFTTQPFYAHRSHPSHHNDQAAITADTNDGARAHTHTTAGDTTPADT